MPTRMSCEIESSPVYWASDVHWRPLLRDGADPMGAFGRFLAQLRGRARAGARVRLYILGDLFDFWYERRGEAFPFYAPHLGALRSAISAGVRLEVLFGNRDFLYDSVLQQACGARVLGDRAEISLDGARILMHHGDLFCTDDRRYQLYRRIARSRLARWLFQLVPMRFVVPVILRMQRWSRAEISRKPEGSMGVIDATVAREHAAGFHTVICGHVHRPMVHTVAGAPPKSRLVTLGPWTDAAGSYAAWIDGQVKLFPYA